MAETMVFAVYTTDPTNRQMAYLIGLYKQIVLSDLPNLRREFTLNYINLCFCRDKWENNSLWIGGRHSMYLRPYYYRPGWTDGSSWNIEAYESDLDGCVIYFNREQILDDCTISNMFVCKVPLEPYGKCKCYPLDSQSVKFR